MTIIKSFVAEYSHLRTLGFSRMGSAALVLADPVRTCLRVLWRICVVTPLFMLGALTVSLWLLLPAARVGEVVSTCIGDAGLMSHFVYVLLLASAVLEGMRYVWRMNSSLLRPVAKEESRTHSNLKDKQR